MTATDWIENESAYSFEAAASPLAPGTYSYWAATAFAVNPAADKAFDADPDGDGLKNGLEYAFLTDPLVTTPSPFNATYDDANTILITLIRNRAATDLQVEIVASGDVAAVNWLPVSVQVVSQIAEGPVDRIAVRPLDTSGTLRFYRLRVQRTP